MPIVIKEVVVKTTVEKRQIEWSQPTEEMMEYVKTRVLRELQNRGVESKRRNRKDR